MAWKVVLFLVFNLSFLVYICLVVPAREGCATFHVVNMLYFVIVTYFVGTWIVTWRTWFCQFDIRFVGDSWYGLPNNVFSSVWKFRTPCIFNSSRTGHFYSFILFFLLCVRCCNTLHPSENVIHKLFPKATKSLI